MDLYFQVIILAMIQGVTEFLPVSSSAHLVILPKLVGWQEFGLAFDIALHLGSLIAVLGYFRVQLVAMVVDSIDYCFGSHKTTDNVKLVGYLILATLPLVILTLILNNVVEQYLHSITVIACSTIVFGVVLYLCERYGKSNQGSVSYKSAVMIGLAQMLALIPGVSRSGITLSAGLFLGLNRLQAATFSFLLSIPAILGAGVFSAYKLLVTPNNLEIKFLGLGFLVSGIVSYYSIHFFLQLLQKIGVVPFVIYRLVLGLGLLFI